MSKVREIKSKEDLRLAFHCMDFTNITILKGEGKYIKQSGCPAHFARISIQIEKAKQSETLISWEVNQEQIPKEFYQTVATAIQEITPQHSGLNFRVLDGMFHEMDSRPLSYILATYFALIQCLNQ